MTMTSALCSVAVAAAVLALIHLLVVRVVVVFKNFLLFFHCENSRLHTPQTHWYDGFHETTVRAWDDVLRLWWYDSIDFIKRSKEAAPFFTIQVDVA